MNNVVDYTPTEKKVIIGKKEIIVRNLTPVFTSQEEREYAGRKVQDGLYQVFRKYVSVG